jgi:hypothetical protein
MIYHVLPVCRQAYIISKNKNGVLTKLLNRRTLRLPLFMTNFTLVFIVSNIRRYGMP